MVDLGRGACWEAGLDDPEPLVELRASSEKDRGSAPVLGLRLHEADRRPLGRVGYRRPLRRAGVERGYGCAEGSVARRRHLS